MIEVLLILFLFGGLGLMGMTGWANYVRPRLQRLAPDDTAPHGLGLFVLSFLVILVVMFALALAVDLDPDDLRESLMAQTVANIAAVLLVLGLASRLPGGAAALGWRRHRGPNPVIAAVCAYLAFLPAFFLVIQLNDALGLDGELQWSLRTFMEQDGASSISIWIAIVLAIPVSEEILMRGALFGGMRRFVRPGAAMLLSGLLFGLLHDPSAMLPVASLGVLLAWLYERTGSLLVPCLVHAIQNSVTLTFAALFGEHLQ